MLDRRQDMSGGAPGKGARGTEPMRLAYLVPEFPGQTHVFFWRELLELDRMGVKAHLFSTRPPNKSIVSHRWSEQAIGQTTYLARLDARDGLAAAWRLPLLASAEIRSAIRAGGHRELRDIVLSIPLAVRLIRECAARGIGHVHVHSCGRAALIAALAHRIGGLRYSLTLHGPIEDYGSLQPLKWRRAEFATIITQKIRGDVEALMPHDLPRRIVVQPMGVDVDTLSRTHPYRPFSGEGPLRIFSCGRLHFVKGHQTIIEAARLLRDRGLSVQVKIAGQDEKQGLGFKRELEAQIDQLELRGQVELLGAIDELAVRQHLLDAHLFVLASKHEPLGVAYMEAMSCEMPVIGTDAGGVRELIDPGVDGMLVPPDNAAALADAIQQIVADPELALELGRRGRAKVAAKFSSAAGAKTLKECVFG